MIHLVPILGMSAQGGEPHIAMVLPFIITLLSIAIFPLFAPHWWEKHYPKVIFCLSLPTLIYYLLILQLPMPIVHVLEEYFSFIALIGSLFVISGNIHIEVKGGSKPTANCIFLLTGAILANVIGTTGASMLLIRPWIRMNHYRITAFHIVFFIFIVSNVGGCLTPIGDPPLFLGYLAGIPFWWIFSHALPGWTYTLIALLIVFYFIDRHNYHRVPFPVQEEKTHSETWKITGWHNGFWLLVVLGAVFLDKPYGLREGLMIVASLGSYYTTAAAIRLRNQFNFHPIIEVAVLFIGIFTTMVPALALLQAHASELHIQSPIQFYFATGILSAFLDNAPTYLTFLMAAMGINHLDPSSPSNFAVLANSFPSEVLAISMGAVFFGALTYIGNGPNFMVRAIAEHAKVRMPSFAGYIFRYSLPILAPILTIVGFLLFWGKNQ